MRWCFIEIVLIGVLCSAVAVCVSFLNAVDWSNISVFFNAHKKLFFALAMNVVLVTLAALAFRIARSMANLVSEIIVGRGEARWQMSIRSVVRHFVITLFVISAFLEIVAINVHLAPEEVWARCILWSVLVLTAVFGWRFFVKAGHRVSLSFRSALEVDEKLAKISREITFTVPEDIIGNVEVALSSPVVGRSIGSLNIRAETGATVVTVIRGSTRIRNVGPRLEILAGDILIAMGNDEEIAKLRNLVGGVE